MSTSPLVTVITPTYNSERFIEETINSVKMQTYENWEMIIIDDCSTDRTVDLVRKAQQDDTRIKLIALTQNSGAARARNKGILNAKGKYVAFLDSDDMWDPHKLEFQINFMSSKNYAFTFSSYQIMDETGNPLNKTVEAEKAVNYKFLLKKPGTIGCLTVILDQEMIGDILMPDITTRQDFALWLKLLRRGYTAYGLPEVFAHYRKVPGSISSNKIKAAKKNWYVYRQIENLGLLSSIWYFINYAIRAVKKTFF